MQITLADLETDQQATTINETVTTSDLTKGELIQVEDHVAWVKPRNDEAAHPYPSEAVYLTSLRFLSTG